MCGFGAIDDVVVKLVALSQHLPGFRLGSSDVKLAPVALVEQNPIADLRALHQKKRNRLIHGIGERIVVERIGSPVGEPLTAFAEQASPLAKAIELLI